VPDCNGLPAIITRRPVRVNTISTDQLPNLPLASAFDRGKGKVNHRLSS
jgi:hypothetical protein